MSRLATSVTLLLLCVGALATAELMRPTLRLVEQRHREALAHLVPERVGEWRALPGSDALVVNPVKAEQMTRLYTEVVSRTYRRGHGDRIMISLAYGTDQQGALALHYPESCYTAQGFSTRGRSQQVLITPFGGIPVTRLQMARGARFEPVTYWALVGDLHAPDRTMKKLVELSYGLRGVVVDGLLFRVSSIGRDSEQAFKLQDRFINELLATLAPAQRSRLAGL